MTKTGGTVQSCSRTAQGRSAKVTFPNPSPPPDTITVEFSELGEEQYGDMKDALGDDLTVAVTYTEGGGNPVSAITLSK